MQKRFAAVLSIFAAFFALAACTPEYARQQGKEAAQQTRLLDSIAVERQNQRLLSHQTQVCLLSANGGDDAGADLLRAMQAGFSGYFLAVGVVGESIDYLRAFAGASCPGASYLFYVQPSQNLNCDSNNVCGGPSQFIITVISSGDQSLVDHITFSIRKSFLSSASERERRQKAFEQLAIVLTGGQ